MKKSVLGILLMNVHMASMACEVCKKQQPGILRGVTHGAGPQSEWDYVIVAVTVLIVVASLYYSIRYIVHPGEKFRTHIKYSIFNID